MGESVTRAVISRRRVLGATALVPVLQTAIVSCASADDASLLNAVAGVDRAAILPGKTYLRGWAGYGDPPRPASPRPFGPQPEAPPLAAPAQPAPSTLWSKESGPGKATFEDPRALVTTATFTAPGEYVLTLTADDGRTRSSSSLHVSVNAPPP